MDNSYISRPTADSISITLALVNMEIIDCYMLGAMKQHKFWNLGNVVIYDILQYLPNRLGLIWATYRGTCRGGTCVY